MASAERICPTAPAAKEDAAPLCDALTGLPDRTAFIRRFQDVAAACGPGRACAVLFVDLDSFQFLNEAFGHAAGDKVLVEAARRIEYLLGPDTLIARTGDDEFAVLMWNISDTSDLGTLGQALVSALAQPVEDGARSLPCGGSVGIAIGPEHGDSAESLLRAAELGLREAKARGRGLSSTFHPRLLAEQEERRSLEVDLRGALDRGELELHYQPLVEIASGRTAGYEALLRWNHPRRGTVSPGTFIPLAEEAGLIVPIGAWVLREALAEAATWNEDIIVAVNVSPAQMRGEALLSQVVQALGASGVAPQRLELEITEGLLMRECDVHMRMLHRLRAFGVRIALDDFGTGFSSLNYLRRFPFDKLKIDRSFITDIATDADSRAIVQAVLGLARQFRMTSLAEGIETEAQLNALKELGCELAQGFLLARPMPSAAIPGDQRRAAPSPPPPASPAEWLRARGCGAFPTHATYCAVNCRKC